jgi:hypothetical protein
VVAVAKPQTLNPHVFAVANPAVAAPPAAGSEAGGTPLARGPPPAAACSSGCCAAMLPRCACAPECGP